MKYKYTHFSLLKKYHNVLVKYKNTHFSLIKTYHNVLVKYNATLWLHSDVLLNNCSSIYINDGYLMVWWVFRILRLLDCFCNVLVYISHMHVQQSFSFLHCFLMYAVMMSVIWKETNLFRNRWVVIKCMLNNTFLYLKYKCIFNITN